MRFERRTFDCRFDVDQQKYAHLQRDYTGTEACSNETANTVGNAINSIATSLHIGYNLAISNHFIRFPYLRFQRYALISLYPVINTVDNMFDFT